MSRISAFKKKINRLEENNNNLEVTKIRCESLILEYRKELKVLRDTVIDQDIKIMKFEDSFTIKYLVIKEKELIELKQEGQCKQVVIDSLQYKKSKLEINLLDAYRNISKMDKLIRDTEDKKIKNRLRKFLIGC